MKEIKQEPYDVGALGEFSEEVSDRMDEKPISSELLSKIEAFNVKNAEKAPEDLLKGDTLKEGAALMRAVLLEKLSNVLEDLSNDPEQCPVK